MRLLLVVGVACIVLVSWVVGAEIIAFDVGTSFWGVPCTKGTKSFTFGFNFNARIAV